MSQCAGIHTHHHSSSLALWKWASPITHARLNLRMNPYTVQHQQGGAYFVSYVWPHDLRALATIEKNQFTFSLKCLQRVGQRLYKVAALDCRVISIRAKKKSHTSKWKVRLRMCTLVLFFFARFVVLSNISHLNLAFMFSIIFFSWIFYCRVDYLFSLWQFLIFLFHSFAGLSFKNVNLEKSENLEKHRTEDFSTSKSLVVRRGAPFRVSLQLEGRAFNPKTDSLRIKVMLGSLDLD